MEVCSVMTDFLGEKVYDFWKLTCGMVFAWLKGRNWFVKFCRSTALFLLDSNSNNLLFGIRFMLHLQLIILENCLKWNYFLVLGFFSDLCQGVPLWINFRCCRWKLTRRTWKQSTTLCRLSLTKKSQCVTSLCQWERSVSCRRSKNFSQIIAANELWV